MHAKEADEMQPSKFAGCRMQDGFCWTVRDLFLGSTFSSRGTRCAGGRTRYMHGTVYKNYSDSATHRCRPDICKSSDDIAVYVK